MREVGHLKNFQDALFYLSQIYERPGKEKTMKPRMKTCFRLNSKGLKNCCLLISRVCSLLLPLLLCAFKTVHATNVCGTINTNTTWSSSGSPYIVTCDVTINPGVTLTIDPGTIVKFNPSRSLFMLQGIGTPKYLQAFQATFTQQVVDKNIIIYILTLLLHT